MLENEKTGVFPIGGEGDRYAFVHKGRVVWAGPEKGCWERWAILAQPHKPAPPPALIEAIRRVSR